MTLHENLKSLYQEILPDDLHNPVDLFIVPLIRFRYKQSDYLYLFYKELFEEKNCRFNIHSTSVWQHWKFVHRAYNSQQVILHYHWLECSDLKSLLGMAYKFLCIVLFKKFGGRLVWTVHNKIPHDSRFIALNYKLRSSMANQADLLHVHCRKAAEEISTFYNQPLSKIRIIPHPSFPATPVSREKAIRNLNFKQKLNLKTEDQIFLMFGNISAYKQTDKVADMFTKLPNHKKLIIVGPVKKGQMHTYRVIKDLADRNENILLNPHFVPEEDVPLYHCASDCVVFNYLQILTSGGVALAQSYNSCIIAPNLGCLTELDNFENAHLFESQEQLFNLLSNFSSKMNGDA